MDALKNNESETNWNNYSESYNELAKIMHTAGIKLSLLDDVVTALQKCSK